MHAATLRPLAMGFLVLAALGAWLAVHHFASPVGAVLQFLTWGRGSWGVLLILQILVALSGVLPASTIGLASGALFGLAAGTALAVSSIFAGAMLAFALTRSAFRPWVQTVLNQRPGLRRLDGAVSRDGWRSVMLLRLSPVMPFAFTSYALGLTSINWRNYLLGTLAALPSLFGYVAIGHFAGSYVAALHTGAAAIKLSMLAFTVLSTLWLTVHAAKIARHSLTQTGDIQTPPETASIL